MVVQGERVPTKDRELKFECCFMASDTEEQPCVPERLCELRTTRVRKTFVPNEMGTSLSVRVTTSRSNQ
jgi:hypothetical protein